MDRGSVLFVEPRGAAYTVFDRFMYMPMLGPLILATLAEKMGWQASVVNENIVARPVSDEELAGADVLAVSCLTLSVDRGKAIARQYRQVRAAAGKPARAIIGGIHASMMPDDVSGDFDTVVVGEGESVLETALDGRAGKRLVGTPVLDLDSLPIPNFSLLKNWQRMLVTPVQTSRGCPFHCDFCSVTAMYGKAYRTMSPERVMKEYRATPFTHYVLFADDNFAANPKRTERILDALIEDNGGHRWGAQIRADVTRSRTLVEKMRRGGIRVGYVGLESVNDASLAGARKRQTVEQLEEAIRIFHGEGVFVHGMFVLGLDEDTEASIRATTRWCSRQDLDSAQFHILTPLPGTDVFCRMEAEGRLLHRDWSLYDAAHVTFRPRHMSPLRLQRAAIKCYRDFYSWSSVGKEALHWLVRRAAAELPVDLKTRPQDFLVLKARAAGALSGHKWIDANRDYLAYLSDLEGGAGRWPLDASAGA